MKNQALFSSKDKSKKFKCRLLQFLFNAYGLKTEAVDKFADATHYVNFTTLILRVL